MYSTIMKTYVHATACIYRMFMENLCIIAKPGHNTINYKQTNHIYAKDSYSA